MSRPKHPFKEVEAALAYAEAGIWSTLKNAGNHAKQLRQVVDGCTTLQADRPLKD